MKYLPLIWAGIWRRPGRAALTIVSIVSAFVIFGVLQSFSSGLDKLVSDAHADLLTTQSRTSQLDALPIADLADIRRTPGVIGATPLLVLAGPWRNPNERWIRTTGIDPDGLRATDTALKIADAQWQALKQTKTGALVSSDLAALYGFKVGDRIPIKPALWANKEGQHLWTVDVVGIFPEAKDDYAFGTNDILVNYDYFDQVRPAPQIGTVNAFWERVDNPANSGRIAAAVDQAFRNSPHETKTYSERQLALQSVAQIGDVGLAVRLITGAVFFALLFSVGAVMIQSGRERTGELGVLKALGFGDGAVLALLLAETLIACVSAAAIGLALSTFLFTPLIRAIQFNLKPGPMVLTGLVAAVVLALVTGAVPAWRARRLSIVDALAGR